MLKNYEELKKVDISQYIEKRDGLEYLNWARCVDLLHQYGAEKVFFTPLLNENGSSLFMTDKVFTDKNGITNQCYEVGVHIVIDDMEFDMRGPLMNGANPVKDNSLSQHRVWNCQTRLFVKGVAIYTGLGFNLWLNEEVQIEKKDKWDDIYNHSIAAIKERVERLVTAKMDANLTIEEIASKCGFRDVEEMRALIRQLKYVNDFEMKLRKL